MRSSPDSGFDTTQLGTPESHWREALQLREWQPDPGLLIVVAPHPDDETLGAGGLIHIWARRELPIAIISVTDGEAACPEVTDLADVRHAELRDALATLSAHSARIIRLQIPDGRIREYRAVLAETLRSIVCSNATIVAPFEHDGHPDHDAAGSVAREIALQEKVTLAAYPIWAWHQATSQLLANSPIGRVTLEPAARTAKRAAIRCYLSQLRERPGGAIVPSHVLTYFTRSYEAFLL